MYKTSELLAAAQEAYQKVWFVQSLDVFERTDQTLSIRLTIKTGLFIQAFIGEITGSLYMEGGRMRMDDGKARKRTEKGRGHARNSTENFGDIVPFRVNSACAPIGVCDSVA